MALIKSSAQTSLDLIFAGSFTGNDLISLQTLLGSLNLSLLIPPGELIPNLQRLVKNN